jgi:hypothetical protein
VNIVESNRATVLRANISEHSPGAHVHTWIKEKPVGLLGICVPVLEFVLRNIAHIPWTKE